LAFREKVLEDLGALVYVIIGCMSLIAVRVDCTILKEDNCSLLDTAIDLLSKAAENFSQIIRAIEGHNKYWRRSVQKRHYASKSEAIKSM
jgi:hypothetical protein